ncbi:outer membrane beta-barrel protein [Pseudoalteromonas shioyasakiensis]|uniref:Porin family protein n=1 Tax=Pseudoalteromonas shioyasakiensis TaxID=1190813 RepID=A0ABT6U3E6_9GAMM|nr:MULTISPECIES: outer membrane beta-barrel protein [Pseudoalteromonas]MCO6356548.1 outer membrane beta-barrel protein [Pseudoalteromonas shioyasakiensis]MDI4670570.1 porin family protein [Pseudoalteromonas shioyasakiensis]MDI4674750.1 porin family protein [Pseudoalteromonas shioyasakiensis]MDI4687479.1 porin family protein [Pseudoalteromonas shioyasakiensis]MDI4706071.1 porin family protein [Pseudoalteromonas shioyasakiensis]
MKFTLLACALSLASTAVMAENTSPLSYDYVEAGYKKTEIDDIDELSLKGFGFSFSKQFAENWYVTGHYSILNDDLTSRSDFSGSGVYDSNNNYLGDTLVSYSYDYDIDMTRYEIGLGYIYSLSDRTKVDFSAKIGQLKIESDFDFKEVVSYQDQTFNSFSQSGSDSETADILSANAQIRHLLTDSFEINAGVGYERLHDEESENNAVFHVGANYAFTPAWLISASYRDANDYSDLALSVRYNF